MVDGGGKRFDEGKERVDLIPPDAMMCIGKVMGYGATKYYDSSIPRPEQNWQRGQKLSKVVGPLLRHLYKYLMGYDLDSESGLPHLAHVAANAIFLLTYHLRGIDKMGDGVLDDVRMSGVLEQ